MFSLLLPLFGLSASLVITGLVLYTLTILVRNFLAGLQAVPDEAREAARGMGYGPVRLLWEVELPLALPAMLAGVRIATVSTVALTTVGAIVDYGGLGTLIMDGLDSDFKAQVLTASVLCVLLAVGADLLLLGLQRWLTPGPASRPGRPAYADAPTAPAVRTARVAPPVTRSDARRRRRRRHERDIGGLRLADDRGQLAGRQGGVAPPGRASVLQRRHPRRVLPDRPAARAVARAHRQGRRARGQHLERGSRGAHARGARPAHADAAGGTGTCRRSSRSCCSRCRRC